MAPFAPLGYAYDVEDLVQSSAKSSAKIKRLLLQLPTTTPSSTRL